MSSAPARNHDKKKQHWKRFTIDALAQKTKNSVLSTTTSEYEQGALEERSPNPYSGACVDLLLPVIPGQQQGQESDRTLSGTGETVASGPWQRLALPVLPGDLWQACASSSVYLYTPWVSVYHHYPFEAFGI